MIKLVRVDHRLLHGQVAMAWTQSLDVDCMLIANDAIMKDEIRKTTLKLAKPNGVKLVMKNIEDSITALHVDLSQCIFHEDSTTKKCDVNVYDGERDYIRADEGKNWAHTTRIRDCDVDYLRDFDVVHTSCNAKLHEDVHKLQDLAAVCPDITIAFFSGKDLGEEKLKELLHRCVHGYGCRLAVTTIGSRGAIVYNGRKYYRKLPYNFEAPVADTTGAGDSWITAFISSYIENKGRMDRLHEEQLPDFTRQADREDYEDQLIEFSMCAGNLLARHNCLVEGSFGYGTAF